MRYRDLVENCSAGATGAGNIAVVPVNQGNMRNAIGAGFNPNGDHGIYDFAKKKKPKKKVSKK